MITIHHPNHQSIWTTRALAGVGLAYHWTPKKENASHEGEFICNEKKEPHEFKLTAPRGTLRSFLDVTFFEFFAVEI